jgi:hypothetical protein
MCAALLKGKDVQVLQAGGHAAAARQVGNLLPARAINSGAHATRTTLPQQQHKAFVKLLICIPALVRAYTSFPAPIRASYKTNMRSFLALASPALALFQTVISAPSHYDPVPYDQAPSYYPGAPWSFPRPANGRLTCTVVAPEDGGNSVPNILEAFQKCGKNGKVIFQDTTCK